MKKNKYVTLFISTFIISAFTFGGGYVIISLLKKKFADELQWISENEMLNLASIAQSAPGAVAVNASILIGYKIAGIRGMLVSILATIIPPFTIISILSVFYASVRDNALFANVLKGMQSGVVAVILDVSTNLGSSMYKESGIRSLLFFLAVVLIIYFFKVNIIIVILVCIGIGLAKFLILEGRKKWGI
ncbi:hypothetical protein IX317_000911 [Fusobacterium sp. DD29]|uniref:chromate transporter n=1 Tax=unclassified Fusobacterium TaxID=2648384 RepID=UPI001B8D40D0|nr:MULTISPECIES: chromate transporter [unclassified Fusobacterium]MBR8700587.1 hypothetical protein [Fusobacterium sp. DD45]MBR8710123.1 hypothetical protein [Fusobacterium sp. DD28]MBR8749247.1 hypothetical protein [Fusobacterium sp. DD29]MBR8750884.1 hypothetical protein [Fusobacterium sp. DD26]MBR8761543.1 hypothetical protein [Fusobacterium sp. DD25]